MENTSEEQLILKVTYNEATNEYTVNAPEGMSVAEMIFGMAVTMRCIKRSTDYSIEEMEELLHKYVTDPQYDELKKED